uniref:CSON008838 protein n=1 Tax=Culicoides sonorensis TaxID=179676 RepID=A0A336MBB7_CULSO
MPSLANNSKATENKQSDSTSETPLNQLLTIVEHKIRNLEKRKTKLDGYRDLEKKGESLTTEQKHACKKYEEVIHSLDLAKEFNKQFAQVVKEANREAKRESKRNAFLRVQQETSKIREVLIIQDILRSLADDSVRQDFLDGTNGAVKIEQSDMDMLEKLYVEVTPKRPTRSDEPTFVQSATHSANTFSSVIDSRPKPFGESTYEHVRETLQSIQNCGYFEKEIIQVETKAEEEVENVNEAGIDNEEKSSETEMNSDSIEAPRANAVPQPEGLIMPIAGQPVQSQIPVQPIHQIPANILPTVPLATNAVIAPAGTVPLPVTTVRAVEQNYYKQYLHQQQIPPPQPTLRPIQEVIGKANFHFLQESELDSSDMIQTQSPYQQPLPPHPSPQQQQKLTPVPMVPGIPTGQLPTTAPLLSNANPIENSNSIIPGTNQQQQQPVPSSQVNQMSIPVQQPSAFTNQSFPNLAQPSIFNSNVLKPSTDQPHIPAFTNVSPQIPLSQVPTGPPQIPGFAMNQQPQNAIAQIAQLHSMIQQQQQQQQHQSSGSIQSQVAKQDLLTPVPMVPGIPTGQLPTTAPMLSNANPIENSNSIIPGTNQQQQPVPSSQVNQMSIPVQQPSAFTNQSFPNLAQPSIFNSNVLKPSTDQPHIPAFTNVSPQIPLSQVPTGPPQIPGFAMNQQPQNAIAQIAQLHSMIQQQQQQQQHQSSGSIQSQVAKQDLVTADDLTEKLKSTLHINDNSSNKHSNNTSNHTNNDNVLNKVTSGGLLSNHDQQNEGNSQDWNEVNNDPSSWSNQMEDSPRNTDRYKRNSGNGNNNIGSVFGRSDNKFGGYRSRNSNSYQNGGNRGGMSNNGNDNSQAGVFFRNNDRYFQNGNKDNTYVKQGGNGNMGYNKQPRSDNMMNNRPPRLQSGAPGDYRSRPGQGGSGRENRGGLKT